MTECYNLKISNVADFNFSNFANTEDGAYRQLFQTILFPKITDVGQSLYISNNSNLTTLDLSSLLSLSKDLVIEDNPLLQTLSLPSLGNVAGDMYLTGSFSR